MIEGALHNVEDLVLHHASLVADRDHDVTFRKFCHTLTMNRFTVIEWAEN
jgi:hypothetical protein